MLRRLPVLVELPMPGGRLIRGVEDRVVEEWIGQGRFLLIRWADSATVPLTKARLRSPYSGKRSEALMGLGISRGGDKRV